MNQPEKDIVCIYHGGCPDGFGAAFAMWLWDQQTSHSQVAFFPGVYQNDPPWDLIAGKDVFLVDFSYKRPVVEKMAAAAKSVTIIDHHVSAMKEWLSDVDIINNPKSMDMSFGNIRVKFDMRNSGCVLTWRHFHSVEEPMMFKFIEDQDLWKFEYGEQTVKNYIKALRSYPNEFLVWKMLMSKHAELNHDGAAIQRWFENYMEELKKNARRMMIGGHNVPVVNANYCFASELAGELAKNEPFAACYFADANRINFSLRSRKGGVDVSEIAKRYGGGGHAQAAGFGIPDLNAL